MLWFAEKFVSLLIEQHRQRGKGRGLVCCDLLKNSYLCLLNNTQSGINHSSTSVVICWKIRIFAYWTTPLACLVHVARELWFAEKFVSLLIEQHRSRGRASGCKCCDLLKNSYLCLLNNTQGIFWHCGQRVVICWKIRIFAYWTTPRNDFWDEDLALWFAEKFVSLLIEQHQRGIFLKTSQVVICWKIRIFAYWTTPKATLIIYQRLLWFAEKFVSLLIEQHPSDHDGHRRMSCDLLKNSYLCLLNNTPKVQYQPNQVVVICWKIRIFAYWTTPVTFEIASGTLLWFAEKFVSLLIEQHLGCKNTCSHGVVICWKIRIFAYWTTPLFFQFIYFALLWFAEKFVSLLIEQHRHSLACQMPVCCDLLKNSYLCLLNNTREHRQHHLVRVVICWKIRIFAYWTTPSKMVTRCVSLLWFAEKFVSLLIEQHPKRKAN